MLRELRKGIVYLLIILGLGGGYYYLTGKSPTSIPSDINAFFNGPQAAPEKNTKRYYTDPEERFGDQLAK